MVRIADIINLRNPLNISNPFQQNGTSAGLIPGTVQYQQENPQKTTLQQAYEQAMSKTTPSWVNALSNAIPSIAQIGALGATKGAFNQGYVADSLEREKQRQMAYNQAKQQQEQNKVKDYVAMAKEQLDMANAEDERNYNRELTKNQIAYQQAKDKIAQQNTDREYELKKSIADANTNKINAEIKGLQNKTPELTEAQKLQNEINKINATENTKNRIEANKELQKANADYSAFKSNIDNLKDLSKKSGNTLQRSWGGVVSLFTGKDNPATAPNNAMQEVKAQLTDAIFKANGIDGDKVTKEQSKIILAKAGMPDSNTLTQSQVNTILNNIESIYKQRIASKQAYANSFNDKEVKIASNNDFSVSWGK